MLLRGTTGKLTEGAVSVLLGLYLDHRQNLLFPNVHFGGGEIDMAVVTKARYLWELEIKLTLADWERDAGKKKWSAASRQCVSRFYYVVPTALLETIPDFVPQTTGILEIQSIDENGLAHIYIRERRSAHRLLAAKLDRDQIAALMGSTYHRFWSQRVQRYFSNQ